VVAAQVVAKWLSGCVSKKVLDQLVDDVRYHQARNRQARKAHDNPTGCILGDCGSRLTEMAQCRRLD